MFTDPQTVTYSAVAKVLPTIGRTENESTYVLNDAGTIYTMVLSHAFKARSRVVARLRRDSYVSDPLVAGNSIPASMTATFTLDFQKQGLTPADAQALGKALVTWLSDANILKLANGET